MSFPRLPVLSLDTDNLDQCVPGTQHSLRSLVAALRAGCAQFAQMEDQGGVRKVLVKSIDGQGLMSAIFRISIWTGGSQLLQKKMEQRFDAIFKVTTTEKLEKLKPMEINAIRKANGGKTLGERKLRQLLFEMAQLETLFYQLVVPAIPSDWFILPRVFAICPSPNEMELEKGYTLIEDLTPRGVLPDLYEGLRAEQVESALTHLARLHAFSMTLAPEVFSRFQICHYGVMKGLEDELAERVANVSAYLRRHRKAVDAFLRTHHSLRTDVHAKMGISAVLCHGDFWANNLFFERLSDGSASDRLCAIIDWQTTHANTGVNDVIRLIFSGVNAKLRRERLWSWLDLYFDTLQEESMRLGVTPPVEYSRAQRQALFSEQCHFELAFTFLALPTLLPGATTEQHRRNLVERLESLFEERRTEYEQLAEEKHNADQNGKKKFFCCF